VKIKFFVSSGERFVIDAPNDAAAKCLALPPSADRFEFWRRMTGDSRIIGHAMVWSIAE
jgi:hypothetical protein